MTDIELCAAAAADAAEIAALEALLFSDAWSESSVAATLSSPLTAAFVLRYAGQAVGYLLASLLAPEGELLRIGVHPSYRKRGFGAQLMEKFLFKAREHACTDLFLEVRADNTAAIGLYRRFGFEDSGLRRAYYKDPPADALLMRRSASLSK